ncbi:hypothetical protein ACWC9R_32760 [Streptomyces sp. NPDC001219]
MRLDSDRRAEELARKRGENPTAASDDPQGPAPADGPPPSGSGAVGEAEG